MYKILIAAFILLVLFAAYHVIQDSKETGIAAPPDLSAHQKITGLTLTEYFQGKKKMIVHAEEASIRSKKIGFFKSPLFKEAHMAKPDIQFFADGKEASRITADSGKMDMGNKKLILEGNARLVTADGKRLSTEEMALDPKLGLLSVRGSFTLEKNGETINGKGLKADIQLERLKIKPVK